MNRLGLTRLAQTLYISACELKQTENLSMRLRVMLVLSGKMALLGSDAGSVSTGVNHTSKCASAPFNIQAVYCHRRFMPYYMR